MKSENNSLMGLEPVMAALWDGKVSHKKGMFALVRYAVITNDSITIRKSQNPSSKVLVEIKTNEIIGIIPAREGAMESFLKGYSGIQIEYKKEGESQSSKVSIFVPVPIFAAQPDYQKTNDLLKALASGPAKGKVSSDDLSRMETGAAQSSSTTNIIIFILFFVMIIGCGVPNALIGVFAMIMAQQVYKNPSLSKEMKILIIGGIAAVALLAILLITIGASYLLSGSR